MVEKSAQVDSKISPFQEVSDLAHDMANRSQSASELVVDHFERIFGPSPPRGIDDGDKVDEKESGCEMELMQVALRRANNFLYQLEEDIANLINRL